MIRFSLFVLPENEGERRVEDVLKCEVGESEGRGARKERIAGERTRVRRLNIFLMLIK